MRLLEEASGEVVALVQVFDEPWLDRPPPEQLAGLHTGCRLVHSKDLAQEAEILSWGGRCRQVQVTADDFGWLGQILAIDQPASSAMTRDLLRWRPVQPGLIEDLDKGHYFG